MDDYQEAVARLARKYLPQVTVRKGIARFSNTAFRIHSLENDKVDAIDAMAIQAVFNAR